MPTRLVICEKPSVAGDVATALGLGRGDTCFVGDGWIVSWAFGHLLEAVPPGEYEEEWAKWDFAVLPMVPDAFRYRARDSSARSHLAKLARFVSDADGFVNACDAGREGELIFALIRDELDPSGRLPVERAWFSSMTTDAIRSAFSALVPGDAFADLEDAARVRSEADWIVGLNATRAATLQMGRGKQPLSLGRVQTPTLALICTRDAAIDSFVAEPYWTVDIDTRASENRQWTSRWWAENGPRIGSAGEADAVVAAVRSAGTVTVERVDVEAKVENPPQLFDLTALQRHMNKVAGWSATRTLAAAQAAYETAKVLTYPRTDSKYLTADMAPHVGNVLGSLVHVDARLADAVTVAASVYATGGTSRTVNDTKVTDHHAIVPTGVVPDGSDADVAALFDVVFLRTVAAVHPAAQLERTVIWSVSPGSRWRSAGTVVVDPGWRSVEMPANDEDDGRDDDSPEAGLLPKVSAGDGAAVLSAAGTERHTTPPARFTEASLLAAMESAGRFVDDDEAAEAMAERGLGTPATRAATIERLLKVGYLLRSGKSLRATWLGRALVDVCGGLPVASPEMTGEWEAALRAMERGNYDVDEFRRSIADVTGALVSHFSGLDRAALLACRPVVHSCPRCDGSIVEGAKGWGCDSWKSMEQTGCGFVVFKTRGGGKKTTAAQLAKAVAANQSDTDVTELGPCPRCVGTVVERARSWGCDSWKSKDDRGCGYVIWKEAAGKKVTAAGAAKMLAEGATNAVDPSTRTIVGDCPVDGCDGEIRTLGTGSGWGCSSWRPPKRKGGKPGGCGTVIWAKDRKANTTLSEDTVRAALTEGRLP